MLCENLLGCFQNGLRNGVIARLDIDCHDFPGALSLEFLAAQEAIVNLLASLSDLLGRMGSCADAMGCLNRNERQRSNYSNCSCD